MKHLLIVFHSQTGKTARMARAVLRGAHHEDIDGVEVRALRAGHCSVPDVVWADAIVLGTPENFGYMSGAMKDFFDRIFYPLETRLEGIPYALFVGAGNDGTGALSSVRRIATGLAMKEVREPIICVGAFTAQHEAACEELGMAMAAGLALGMF